MTTNFDLSFLDRSLRTTAVVFLVLLPFSLYYIGVFSTLAAFSGGVWGMINLIFISALVRSAIRPGGADKSRTLILALIKFPLLYSSGFFLLMIDRFNPLHLLIGFTSVLAIIVLKAVGRLILSLDESQVEQQRVERPAR